MPKILSEDGFDIIIYYNDHPPPHVHVVKGGRLAKILIGYSREIIESSMSASDEKKAVEIVTKHRDKLHRAWQQIHGE